MDMSYVVHGQGTDEERSMQLLLSASMREYCFVGMMRETKDESFLAVWIFESIGSRVPSLKIQSMLVTVTIVPVPQVNPTACWWQSHSCLCPR